MSPYITEATRKAIEKYGDSVIQHPGELNYKITTVMLEYLKRISHNRKLSYADYNVVIGVLESAKLEFYRRAVSKYEDEKIKENGDVYND